MFIVFNCIVCIVFIILIVQFTLYLDFYIV